MSVFVNEGTLRATTGILVLTSTNAGYQFRIIIGTSAEVTVLVRILRVVIVVSVTPGTRTTERVVYCVSTSTNAVPTANLFARETVKTSPAATSALVQEAGVCPEVKIARTWTNATIDQEFAELACVKTKSEVTTVYAKAAF